MKRIFANMVRLLGIKLRQRDKEPEYLGYESYIPAGMARAEQTAEHPASQQELRKAA